MKVLLFCIGGMETYYLSELMAQLARCGACVLRMLSWARAPASLPKRSVVYSLSCICFSLPILCILSNGLKSIETGRIKRKKPTQLKKNLFFV